MVWLDVSNPARMKAPISGSSCVFVRGLPAAQDRAGQGSSNGSQKIRPKQHNSPGVQPTHTTAKAH
jgi:hypothetical protein